MRQHPPRSSFMDKGRGLGLVAVVCTLAAGGCFDSDERLRSNEDTSSEAGETIAVYETDDEGSDDNWTAEETGPSETTCRDAIDCLVTCQAVLILNPQAEPDLECFLECDMGLSTEEAYLLIKLAECIGDQCTAQGACGAEDSSDQDCLICIAGNAQDPQPQGCIEEAAACD
ncbi:hypothetical protein [Enhygromyxa salina]|nr:hypothetical protein [Enhygromyxa salina]